MASGHPQADVSWGSWLLSSVGLGSKSTPQSGLSADAAAATDARPEAAQGQTSGQQPSADEQTETLPIAGTWQKDENASDAQNYAEQIAMLHMSSLYSYAALHYMWGLELKVDDQGFSKKYLVKHVPAFVFSEVEHFKFGESTTMARRDRRSGKQEAVARSDDGHIVCDIKWGEPYSGTVKEVYELLTPQVLHITSTLACGDKTVTALQVYNKQ